MLASVEEMACVMVSQTRISTVEEGNRWPATTLLETLLSSTMPCISHPSDDEGNRRAYDKYLTPVYNRQSDLHQRPPLKIAIIRALFHLPLPQPHRPNPQSTKTPRKLHASRVARMAVARSAKILRTPNCMIRRRSIRRKFMQGFRTSGLVINVRTCAYEDACWDLKLGRSRRIFKELSGRCRRLWTVCLRGK